MTGSEGQDWAGYQENKPPTAGLAFVVVKATEGTGYVNPKYTAQIATSRASVAVVGHYHFGRPGSMSAQVDYFVAHTSIRPGDVLAFDWEDPGVSSADKDAWIRDLQARLPAHRIGLYCNRDYWINRDQGGFCGDFLWIADPSAPKGKPRIQSDWLIHQYSDAGGIDRDYSHLTAAQLSAWATGQTPNIQEPDMPLTPADATLVANTLLALLKDDPTTTDDSKKPLGNQLWDTGKNAFQANNAAQAVAKQLTNGVPLTLADDQVAALATKLAANPAFSAGIADAVAANLAARLQS